MLKRILVTIGAGVLGVLLLVFGFKEFSETRKLKKEGLSATAEVVDHEEKSGRRGRIRYYLTAKFKTEDGKSVSARRQVASEVYADAIQANSVPVTYLKAAPNCCRFGKGVSTDFTRLGVGVFLLGAAGVNLVRRK